jgi:hypothetical protein
MFVVSQCMLSQHPLDLSVRCVNWETTPTLNTLLLTYCKRSSRWECVIRNNLMNSPEFLRFYICLISTQRGFLWESQKEKDYEEGQNVDKRIILKSISNVWNGVVFKLHDLSPRANYNDWATAACRRSDCQFFADRGCHVVSVTDPYGRILDFLDRSSYFSIK